jgi:hypothetical protein
VGDRCDIDGCYTEPRGLLRRAFLVSSSWEVPSVTADHKR